MLSDRENTRYIPSASIEPKKHIVKIEATERNNT